MADQAQQDQSSGRTMRLHEVGERLPLATPPTGRFAGGMSSRPSARRSDEERERRHRERAIAAWLRDLSR